MQFHTVGAAVKLAVRNLASLRISLFNGKQIIPSNKFNIAFAAL